MNLRPAVPLRAVAVALSAALAAGGLSAVTAPAQAAVSVTDYGFQTFAYGTRAVSGTAGLRSAPTAHSYVACTKRAGLRKTEVLAEANVPQSDPQVHVEGLSGTSETYRTKRGDIGTRSISRISRLVIGADDNDPTTPTIVITGMQALSQAWADKNGRFHTKNTVTSGSVSGHTGTPLDDVLGQVTGGIGDVIDAIDSNGGSYEIPGLGTLSLGASATRNHATWARAAATIFRLDVSGAKSVITIGRTAARINRELPAGVMGGAGYGAEVPGVLGGLLRTGRLGAKLLPCQGTNGKTRSASLAGLNLANAGAIQLGAMTGRVNGIQKKDGSGRAWTQGEVASLGIGPIQLTGIVGRAQVTRTAKGKIRKSIQGSTIGSLSTDGGKTTQAIPDPGESVVVPGVAELTFFTKQTTTRSVGVTAVTVKLLSNDYGPVETVIKLGNARAAIKRS